MLTIIFFLKDSLPWIFVLNYNIFFFEIFSYVIKYKESQEKVVVECFVTKICSS